MEPLITTGIAVYALNTDIAQKLLGPTIEYIGNESKNLVARCNINLNEIFTKAAKKSPHKLESEGQVSPRVLRILLNEGAFCSNSIVQEYYAGILAASKTENQEDDRGIMFMNIVASLTIQQIKMHHLIFMSIAKVFNINDYKADDNHGIFIPNSLFIMNKNKKYWLEHALEGLVRQRLIDPNYSVNQTINKLQNYNQDINQAGFVVTPLATGEELFMWSLGKENLTFIDYLDYVDSEKYNLEGLLKITHDVVLKSYQEATENLSPVPIYIENSN